MSEEDWKTFIIDMLECIEKIEKYLMGMGYDEFMKDDRTKDAVVRNLEIICEAANKIPDSIKDEHNEIPWSQIVGLRNLLIHGYFVVDYDIVWTIVKNELPDLKKKLMEIMKGVV